MLFDFFYDPHFVKTQRNTLIFIENKLTLSFDRNSLFLSVFDKEFSFDFVMPAGKITKAELSVEVIQKEILSFAAKYSVFIDGYCVFSVEADIISECYKNKAVLGHDQGKNLFSGFLITFHLLEKPLSKTLRDYVMSRSSHYYNDQNKDNFLLKSLHEQICFSIDSEVLK